MRKPRARARMGRICATCVKRILRGHKWYVDGVVVRHEDCSNPTLKPQGPGPLFKLPEKETETDGN